MLQSQTLKIEISKWYSMGEFTHWEWDLTGPDGSWLSGGTCPSFHGAVDAAIDWENELSDGTQLSEWTKDDANERGNDE